MAVFFLLDTHALYWILAEPQHLDSRVKDLYTNPQHKFYATAVSLHEMAMKINARKWPGAQEILKNFEHYIQNAGLEVLTPIITDYVNSTRLPDIKGHKDPYDKLIIAMAIARSMILVSSDHHVPHYPVDWIYAGRSPSSDTPRGSSRIMPEEPLTPIRL